MAETEHRLALVTGATGFTGGHLARALLERGWRVRALVRRSEAGKALAAIGVQVAEGDITDPKAVIAAVSGCSHVFHIAAYYRGSSLDPQIYRAVNVEGTRHVLDAAKAADVERVVHCSTVGVHGDVSQVPADENAPFAPGDIYQETKLEGEMLAAEAFANGLPGAIVRPAGIYGPGDLRFLKLFRTIHKRQFRMFGTGEVLYHFTHVADLVEGLLLAATEPRALGETVIVAGPRYITLNELVRLVADAVDVEPPRGHLPIGPLLAAARLSEAICRPLGLNAPLQVRQCDFFIKDRAFDTSKAHRLLGFTPAVTLSDGLRQTADWYFREGHLKRR